MSNDTSRFFYARIIYITGNEQRASVTESQFASACKAAWEWPRMGPLVQFLRPFDLLDRESMIVVSGAFDQALLSLHDTGKHSIVREVIAHRMLDLAARGERDVALLCSGALGQTT